jgi:hypothetical protein
MFVTMHKELEVHAHLLKNLGNWPEEKALGNSFMPSTSKSQPIAAPFVHF